MVLWGYDTDNRPALYLRPSKQNTEESIRQVHFVVWALERLTELMGPGVEYVHKSSITTCRMLMLLPTSRTLALMVDFADRAKNPSLTQSRLVLNILQTHCPSIFDPTYHHGGLTYLTYTTQILSASAAPSCRTSPSS